MHNVLILFGNPVDSDAFDQHFDTTFRGLLHAVPEVERITLNQVAGAAHGNSAYYLIVELQFPSDEALQQGLNSEVGQAMAADLSDFATGGVEVLFAQSEFSSIETSTS